MFGQKVELSDLAGTNDQGASQKVNFDVETLKTSTTEVVDEAIDVQQSEYNSKQNEKKNQKAVEVCKNEHFSPLQRMKHGS